MCIIMTTGMERPTSITTTPNEVNMYDVEGGQQGDDVVYQDDEYVQLALFSLMKNLLCNVDECQTPESPSIPSTPIDVTDAFQYKLDQAADSVKHHLLYAVREEVDALRGKVSDLERKIYRLEKENTLLLREYVPPEILEQMRASDVVVMTDRHYMKFRPSSAANSRGCLPPPPVQQQQTTTTTINCKNNTTNLSVSIRANNASSTATTTKTITDKTHLINGAVHGDPSNLG